MTTEQTETVAKYGWENIMYYAQGRADATGGKYIVTNMGHVFPVRGNKRLAEDLGGIRYIMVPNRRHSR